MKVKIKYFQILFLLLANISVNGQNKCSQKTIKQEISGDMFTYYYLQYTGTPLFNKEWGKGSVLLSSGQFYENVDLNFDIYRDNLLYFNKINRKMVKVDNDIVKEFWLENQHDISGATVHFVNMRLDSVFKENGFLCELVKDTISLYLKYIKNIEFDNMNYATNGKLGRYYDKIKYYYIIGNNIFELPSRKHKLLKEFPEYKLELKRFIFKNRYSVKNINHMALIFEELNKIARQ